MKPYGGLASAEDRTKLIAFLQSPLMNYRPELVGWKAFPCGSDISFLFATHGRRDGTYANSRRSHAKAAAGAAKSLIQIGSSTRTGAGRRARAGKAR